MPLRDYPSSAVPIPAPATSTATAAATSIAIDWLMLLPHHLMSRTQAAAPRARPR
ncbi:MAG: hypothetical protein U9Q37_02700 [Euryarchaeota archaeon]|nr:hypothetical protein [Euryarchaeota archaeon]